MISKLHLNLMFQPKGIIGNLPEILRKEPTMKLILKVEVVTIVMLKFRLMLLYHLQHSQVDATAPCHFHVK